MEIMAPDLMPRPALTEFYTLQFELREFQEVACPGVYLAQLELPQTLGAKFFYRKTAKNGAVNHGAAQSCIIRLATAREIPHKAARERISRACGIVRFLKRKCRNAEDAVLVHQHCSIFAAFYDQCGRTELKNVARRAEQIMFA